MPRHWKEPTDTPWFGAKEWAVGQGMQLRDSLAASGSPGAQFDLAGVRRTRLHSPATTASPRRKTVGVRKQVTPDARRVSPHGTLRASWSSATRRQQPMRPTAGKLESEIATLSSLMGQLSGDREQIAASADRAADAGGTLLTRELERPQAYDQAFTLQVMRRIASRFEPLAAGTARRRAGRDVAGLALRRLQAEREARTTTICRARSKGSSSKSTTRRPTTPRASRRKCRRSALRSVAAAGRKGEPVAVLHPTMENNTCSKEHQRLAREPYRPGRALAQVGAVRQRTLLGQRARRLQS